MALRQPLNWTQATRGVTLSKDVRKMLRTLQIPCPAADKVRILFLGPCNMFVENQPETAYPEVCVRTLKTRFPQLNIVWDRHRLMHPAGLLPRLRASLGSFQPDIMVVNFAAVYAAVPLRMSMIAMMAPDVLHSARAFLHRVEARLRTDSAFARMIRQRSKITPIKMYQPVKVDEYQRLATEALEFCKENSSCRLVLMGPGGFNEYGQRNCPLYLPDLWAAVNLMVTTLGRRFGLPVANPHDMMESLGSAVYVPDSDLWSAHGHQLVAREVENVVAGQILALTHPATLPWDRPPPPAGQGANGRRDPPSSAAMLRPGTSADPLRTNGAARCSLVAPRETQPPSPAQARWPIAARRVRGPW